MCAALWSGAKPADAAPYTVWACADGSGRALDAADWRPYRHESDRLSQMNSTCGTPASAELGRLQAIAQATAHTPHQPGGGVGWQAAAAPATAIAALDLWWVRHVNPESQPPWGWLTVETDNQILYAQNDGLLGTFSTVSPGVAYGSGNHQRFSSLDAQNVKLQVMCQNHCDLVGSKVAGTFSAFRLRLTIDDRVAPSGGLQGLSDGARVDAPLTVSAQATDAGSGVRAIELRIDGTTVDSVGGGDRCRDVDASNADPNEYDRIKPCAATFSGSLSLRPEHLPLPDGHVAAVVVVDAAGQETVIGEARVARAAPTGFYARDVGFLNPDLNIAAPRSINGVNGGPARMRLTFVVKRQRGKRVITKYLDRHTVRYGRRALYRGRLTTPEGSPIAGARVWRAVAPTGQDWRLSGAPLITSKTGRVSGWTSGRGGTRRMALVYFPYSDANGHGATPPRPLAVRAATTIQLDQAGYRNGDTARFFGHIVSGPVLTNKLVYLQALVRRQWRTFATTRADSVGRWRLRYRFSATRRLITYRFRAVVPAEQGFPWSTGHSRVMRVTVAP